MTATFPYASLAASADMTRLSINSCNAKEWLLRALGIAFSKALLFSFGGVIFFFLKMACSLLILQEDEAMSWYGC